MSWKAFLSRNVQSVKILACPQAASSAGARAFWESSYGEIKALNPRFPFMLRPNPEASPYMLVEYDFAEKAKIDLAGLSAQEVEAKLKQAVEAAASKPKSEMQSAAVFKLPSIIN